MFGNPFVKSLLLLKNPCVSCVHKMFTSAKTVSVQRTLLKPASVMNFDKKYLMERDINPGVENKLKGKDRIPENYRIIYRAPLNTYIKASYWMVVGSVVFLPTVIGSCIIYGGEFGFPIYMGHIVLMNDLKEFLAFTAGLLLFTLNISVIVYKYPFRIYADAKRENYIAVFQHLLPWMTFNEKFLPEDFKKAKGLLPYKDSLYSLGTKEAILFEEHFSTPSELNNLLADKPVKVK